MSFTIGTEFDLAINWEARLQYEMPFLRAWLNSWNSREILDMACGGGRHGVALARLGFNVTGVDCDELMIQRARQLAATAVDRTDDQPAMAAGTCRFVVGDLLDNPGLEPQDAVLCLGNSLSLLRNEEELGRVLRNFRDMLAPRGGVLLHVLNYTRFRNPANAFFPLKTDQADGRVQRHFLKMIDVNGAEALVHLVRIEEEAGVWMRRVKSDRLLVLHPAVVQASLLDAGFGEVQVYGSLKGELHCEDSHDLVMCARRT